MARLHTGIIALCLFALTCTVHAEVGTVRLLEERPIFTDPAVSTAYANSFVKVSCPDPNISSAPATPTTDPIHPLLRVPVDTTLTIVEVIRCFNSNAAFVKVRTPQNITGYTQLPNYHQRVQPADAEGAFMSLYLNAMQCGSEPECNTDMRGKPFEQFIRRYPTSNRVPYAAAMAFSSYDYAATTYQTLATNPATIPALSNYTSRYTRDTLLAKANEYRTLATEMKALANQQPPPQQPVSATPQPTTSAALSNLLTPIYYALLILLTLVYIIAYGNRYTNILDHIPSQEIGNSIIEGFVFLLLATAIAYFLADYLKPFVLIAFGLLLYIRLDARLQPARDKRAADELKRKQETLNALTPLLNALHATYGRYSDMPELTPANWYQPRKHYIEYMAAVLYTFHKERNTYHLDQHGITADTHPLVKLRWLYFPTYELQPAELQDPRHPYNVLTRAITDPSDRDHNIFRDLIPQNADLIPYLTGERWREPLARQAHELEILVTQEITKQQYVIIGMPPNRNEYPLPIFYRDQRFRHTYVIGKTGSGKSTLLRNLIAQDIHYGNGVIVLSPENDLFERLLAFIPEERKDDLIYFDPTDTKPPIIGFNPLALEAGEDLTQKAGETMTALKRALGDLGVTMEPLIQNAVYALLQRPQSTFADLARLIDPYDANLRATVKNDPTIDETTRTFWQRYERSSYYQKSNEAVLNRLNPFFRPPISTILATPSLSFKTELNADRRIIFLNLSRPALSTCA